MTSFFFIFLLKFTKKWRVVHKVLIWSLNIRQYLRENSETRKTGSMLMLACKANTQCDFPKLYFISYFSLLWCCKVCITHTHYPQSWHLLAFRSLRDFYLHFSWFMWKWKHKGRGGKPKKVFAILDTESYKYKYNYFINRFLM